MVLIKYLFAWQKKNWLKNNLHKIDEYILKYYAELSLYLKTEPISFSAVPKLDCISFMNTTIKNFKSHHSGRYAKTFLKSDDKRIIKIQKIKHKRCLKELVKEIYISFFLSKKNLAPKIYDIGICFGLNSHIDFFKRDRNNSMYIFFEMDFIPHLFFDLFPDDYIDELASLDRRQNFFKSRYFNQFNLAIKMCIGAIEYMLKNNIHYGDLHDGNMGFSSSGKILFFDFGRSRVINKNIITDPDKLEFLYEELIYFRDMYFLDSKRVNVYATYEKSHLCKIIKELEEDTYKFGDHIKWLDKKIDIKFVNEY